MLVLTRKIGEKLRIGDDIEITVLQADNPQVKLGIHAPRDISVHREEIYQKIQKEKQEKKLFNR